MEIFCSMFSFRSFFFCQFLFCCFCKHWLILSFSPTFTASLHLYFIFSFWSLFLLLCVAGCRLNSQFLHLISCRWKPNVVLCFHMWLFTFLAVVVIVIFLIIKKKYQQQTRIWHNGHTRRQHARIYRIDAVHVLLSTCFLYFL